MSVPVRVNRQGQGQVGLLRHRTNDKIGAAGDFSRKYRDFFAEMIPNGTFHERNYDRQILTRVGTRRLTGSRTRAGVAPCCPLLRQRQAATHVKLANNAPCSPAALLCTARSLLLLSRMSGPPKLPGRRKLNLRQHALRGFQRFLEQLKTHCETKSLSFDAHVVMLLERYDPERPPAKEGDPGMRTLELACAENLTRTRVLSLLAPSSMPRLSSPTL